MFSSPKMHYIFSLHQKIDVAEGKMDLSTGPKGSQSEKDFAVGSERSQRIKNRCTSRLRHQLVWYLKKSMQFKNKFGIKYSEKKC